MSVCLYTGRMGHGKTMHMARDCYYYLRAGKTVISNQVLNVGMLKNIKVGIFKKRSLDIGNYIHKTVREISVKWLVNYAVNNLKKDKKGRVYENQFLLALDECHVLFNCRDYDRDDRNDWIEFFKEHRKIGYEIILVTQDIFAIDKQIRKIVEDEIRHRKIEKMGGLFAVIGWLCPFKVFACVTFNLAMRLKTGIDFFSGSKFLYEFFDSYSLLGTLDKFIDEEMTVAD